LTLFGSRKKERLVMKKLVVVFTILIVLLSLTASLAGAFSYGHDDYMSFTTARGETVQVQLAGIYRYSLQSLVTGGTPWDFVRLLVGIPLLLISFVLYLRGSLRGTVVFIGCLASFLYQYLLWTFDWAYNSLFLVYVALFSLSLWTLILVLADIDRAEIRAAIGERFPVRTVAGFSFAVGGLLLLKCLGEIVPGLGSGTMPAVATGYYTLVDQALDLGLLTPFCVLTGVLLLKGDCLGYLLSSSSLIILFSVGLSVIAGEIMLGLSIGQMNIAGVTVFLIFVSAALALLTAVLASIKTLRPIDS
jgi:hypothetical protein